MGSVRRRRYAGGWYWEGWYRDSGGKWRGFNTGIVVDGTASRRAAEELVVWKESHPAGREQEKMPLTIGAAGERWVSAQADLWGVKTAQNRRDSLRKAEAYFGGRGIDQIGEEEIRGFRKWLRQTLSAATVNSKLTDLYALLRFAREAGWGAQKPRREFLRQPARNDDYLTESELAALLEASAAIFLNGQSVRPFFAFAALTAMRRGEILACSREWVREGILHIPGAVTKNGKPRRVPIGPKLAALLTELPERGRLFPAFTEEISRKFQSAVRQIGIERPIKLHNLRDTYVTNALREGMDLRVLREIVGDELKTLFGHYAGITEAELRLAGR